MFNTIPLKMEPDEAILMIGAERYSNYDGYDRTFRWKFRRKCEPEGYKVFLKFNFYYHFIKKVPPIPPPSIMAKCWPLTRLTMPDRMCNFRSDTSAENCSRPMPASHCAPPGALWELRAGIGAVAHSEAMCS